MLGQHSAQNPPTAPHMVQSKARSLPSPARQSWFRPSPAPFWPHFLLFPPTSAPATEVSPLLLRCQQWASTSGFCTCLSFLSKFRPSQRSLALASPINPTPDSFYSPPCLILTLYHCLTYESFTYCIFALFYLFIFCLFQASKRFLSLFFITESSLPQIVPGIQLCNKWVNPQALGVGLWWEHKEGRWNCTAQVVEPWFVGKEDMGGNPGDKLLEMRACLMVPMISSASATWLGPSSCSEIFFQWAYFL